MAQGHRRVRLLARQQHGNRLAHDVAAADHDGVLALDVHPRELDQLDDAVGRARQEAALPDEHLADVDGREAVDVLLRRDRVDDRLVADVLRHGQLHEDAVDRRIGVEVLHELDERLLRRLGRQADLARVHARLRARLLLGRHVAHARGIVPHENDREPGRHALRRLEFRHARGDFRPQVLRQLLSVDDLHAAIIAKKRTRKRRKKSFRPFPPRDAAHFFSRKTLKKRVAAFVGAQSASPRSARPLTR